MRQSQPKGEPQISYQTLVTVEALQRLEEELKEAVWAIPRAELPTFVSKDPELRAKMEQEREEEIRKQQERAKDVGSADHIYSRSAAQRFILQLLANDLHGPDEQSRDFHDYQVFKTLLSEYGCPNIDRLKPNVTSFDRPPQGSFRKPPDVFGAKPSSPLSQRVDEPLSKPVPPQSSQQVSDTTTELTQNSASSRQPLYRPAAALDMNFPNLHRRDFVLYRR